MVGGGIEQLARSLTVWVVIGGTGGNAVAAPAYVYCWLISVLWPHPRPQPHPCQQLHTRSGWPDMTGGVAAVSRIAAPFFSAPTRCAPCGINSRGGR